jgi:hypothetical protein
MKIITKFLLMSGILFTVKNMCFLNQKSLVSKLFNKLEDIDHIELKIINPKKVNINSILNTHKYILKMYIITKETYLIKTIEDNNYVDLINKTEEFIDKYSRSLNYIINIDS